MYIHSPPIDYTHYIPIGIYVDYQPQTPYVA